MLFGLVWFASLEKKNVTLCRVQTAEAESGTVPVRDWLQ